MMVTVLMTLVLAMLSLWSIQTIYTTLRVDEIRAQAWLVQLSAPPTRDQQIDAEAWAEVNAIAP